MVIQLCFQIKDAEHNAMVIKKLKEIKKDETYKFISCHMPRHIVETKGWSTEMIDALEEIFGAQYECLIKDSTFEEAINNINTYRTEAAKKADKILIIGEQSIANIALEIELFTQSRVHFI